MEKETRETLIKELKVSLISAFHSIIYDISHFQSVIGIFSPSRAPFCTPFEPFFRFRAHLSLESH